MARYLVQPTPDLDTLLLPDDEVWLTYNVSWDWEYALGMEIGKLEQRLESDNRFVLTSYSYDPDAKTVTFKCRVRRPEEMFEKVRMAGMPNGQVLVNLVAVALGLTFAYFVGKQVQVWRDDAAIKAAIDEGILSPEQEAAIFAEMGRNPDGTSITEAVVSVGSGLGLIALAVLAWIFFGSHR